MASPVFTAIGIPDAAMHRRHAAPRVTAVFDVVVHEKCVVQHFQAGGGGKRILRAAAQRARGRDAERGRRPLPDSVDEVLHEPIQVPLRFPRRYAFCKRIGEHLAIPAQAVQEARWAHDIAGGWHGVGDLDQHILRVGTSTKRRAIVVGSTVSSSLTSPRRRRAGRARRRRH